MFHLLPKKKKNSHFDSPPLCSYNEFAEFSVNEIRGEKEGEGGIRSKRFCRWRREPSGDVRMQT